MQGIQYSNDSNKEELNGHEGAILLIGAMFRLTAQDLRYGTNEVKRNARAFLKSKWFLSLCDGMDVDPLYVKKLIKSSKVKSRNSYE